MVIESTGISEPMQVAELFTFPLREVDPHISADIVDLNSITKLDTCLTVVDASTFSGYFNSRAVAAETFDDIDDADGRSVFHLLTEQVEFANVILLNKCDLVSELEKAEVKKTIKALNEKAIIIETVNSDVDLTKVLHTGLFNFEEAEAHSKWLVPSSDIDNCDDEYGISSF